MEDPQTPEELARIHEQLWQTVLQFGNFSASQERNRIARDLHDSLGQALTALNIQLQTAVKLWQLDPERAEQFLEEAQRLGSTAVQEVRQTVRTLRTDCPDDQSIDTLINSLVESFHRSTGVLPTVKLNLAAPMPPEVVTPVYRIVQEALNNICKYAQATEVNVQLSTTPTSLGLIIEDNGRGFDQEQAVTGFGLRGMQERVSLLRGRFQIETEPGKGCRIRVVMPLRVLSLQDAQGLIPPPPTPDSSLAPAIAAPPPATSVERNGGVDASLQPDAQELTHVSDAGVDDAPAVLPLMGEPDADDSLAAALPLTDESDAEASHYLQSATSPDLDVTTLPGLVLTAEQHDRLTQILLEWVGPIAPMLLHSAIAQAQQSADLIDQLAVHVPPQRQAQFAQQVQTVFRQSTSLADSAPSVSANSVLDAFPVAMPQSLAGQTAAIDAELTHYCEQELMALIGPVAHFLIQEAIATSPNLSLEALADYLAANIPNPQTATQFKQRILSYAS